jgi:phosphoglucomutase
MEIYMNEKELYSLWCEKAVDDPDLQTELKSIEGNNEAIQDRFYRDLEFGTGGLRGVIGAGSYRMNIYTIRRATQGLADYVNGAFNSASVAIAYDSRIKSDVFAKEAASVLAANGIKVYIYSELMPTPMLSYAVRRLSCSAGIVVTASHNPAKYNGYKVYGSDGCQLTLDAAEIVLQNINKVPMFDGAKLISFEDGIKNGNIEYIKQDVIDSYLEEVAKQGIHTDVCASSGLKVVYTPLNGTGNKPVRAILNKIGIKDITVVPEQEYPNGNFTTCPFPNPEIKEALAYGLKLCETVKPDLLLATDPDADRVGIAVPSGDDYVLFTGNEVGALLLEYICAERTKLGTMPKNPIAVKTIVTTDITRAIAKEYGVEIIEVLTGFKFIGEQIGFLEEKKEENRYIFGFEESYGYLAGTYVRDKDAVVASMLICEMAAFYRTKGISLIQARENLYKKYGVYVHTQKSFTCEGASGMQKMHELMSMLRTDTPKEIGGLAVTRFDDYIAGTSVDKTTGSKTKLTLPKSDVLTFVLEGGASVIIRPSGTEPKIKAYYTTTGSTREEAAGLEIKISADFQKILGF